MRWLMVVSSLDASDGGPPQAVLGLSQALAAHGEEVEIVTHRHATGIPHYAVEDALRAGVTIHWVPRRRATRFQFSPGLLRAARKHAQNVDVVTSHGFYQFTCIAGFVAASQSDCPLMLQPHGVFEPFQETVSTVRKRAFRRVIGNRVLARTQYVVAASRSEEDGIETTLGRHTPPILMAGLGVDIPELSNGDKSRFASRNVLFLSRIAPKKRLDKLLTAAKELSDLGRPIRLTVCGDGDPEYMATTRASVPAGIDVDWRGHVSGQVRDAVESGVALFCLPSDNENFGQVITESMAHGLPVVTTRASGASEHVANAGAGWVLDKPDATALASCLDHALSDPQLLSQMAQKGLDYARERLTWDVVAQRWITAALESKKSA